MKKPHTRKLLDRDAPDPGESSSLPRDYYLVPPLTPAIASAAAARKPLQPMSTFDSSMALTVVVLLTALFFMGFFSVYIRRFAEENALELSRRRRQQRRAASSASCPRGVDPTTVKSLPVYAYDGEAKEPVDCAVCLSEFEERESVKVIPYCGHVFHPQCIDMWLSAHGSCPLCRSTQLFPKNSDVSLDDKDRGDDHGGCCDPQQISSTVDSRDTSSISISIETVVIREEEEEEEEVVVVRPLRPAGLRRTKSYCWRSGEETETETETETERASLPRSFSF
ncbi:PREDICTED: RING-H2 finger protein ATL57-like [Nelumbo nucifera]|uniref:RING-type E3 ubiquitin transferase n=1 Tax=Nelumbo nucifera TaxID=4432 RepID=A0A1U8AI21_NELNU|nr:PREDICTED: RING-H2 finger protein ATL57-like [Nelumbo nucifera]XP_010267320.1 PREDICTED: RING-H2 finger protein ATL57-like [Nelumbo nucifera]XP_010267321.1 PREDICTED: RING-H2 finger protein ATL57-like [Nelumbo nucifera]XP_010267322.1 PREDICTED: RING-H2 finger protein ATL57-like [Nelumbo nucifera]XP_010267323.1 PREDICTED: RING-H2 finger protein ATL57-like [Nelumbo nucifera]XP_019054528.1 PREDICTED: RING-H2 finger protein ATL57-like [Nelumbo nucifera]